MKFADILGSVDKNYEKLRKPDGKGYGANRAKSLVSALSANGLFRRGKGQVWGINEQESKEYTQKEIGKFVSIVLS